MDCQGSYQANPEESLSHVDFACRSLHFWLVEAFLSSEKNEFDRKSAGNVVMATKLANSGWNRGEYAPRHLSNESIQKNGHLGNEKLVHCAFFKQEGRCLQSEQE